MTTQPTLPLSSKTRKGFHARSLLALIPLLCSFPTWADNLAMDTDVVDSVTRKVVSNFKSEGDIKNLFQTQKTMVQEILTRSGINFNTLPKHVQEQINKPHTNSVRAFVSFATGLDRMDQGDILGARMAFRQAAALDPGFAQALESEARTPRAGQDTLDKIKSISREKANNTVAKIVNSNNTRNVSSPAAQKSESKNEAKSTAQKTVKVTSEKVKEMADKAKEEAQAAKDAAKQAEKDAKEAAQEAQTKAEEAAKNGTPEAQEAARIAQQQARIAEQEARNAERNAERQENRAENLENEAGRLHNEERQGGRSFRDNPNDTREQGDNQDGQGGQHGGGGGQQSGNDNNKHGGGGQNNDNDNANLDTILNDTNRNVDRDSQQVRNLADQISKNPGNAGNLLGRALSDGVDPNIALETTLSNIRGADQNQIGEILVQAFNNGVNVEQVRDVIRNMESSGGGCQ